MTDPQPPAPVPSPPSTTRHETQPRATPVGPECGAGGLSSDRTRPAASEPTPKKPPEPLDFATGGLGTSSAGRVASGASPGVDVSREPRPGPSPPIARTPRERVGAAVLVASCVACSIPKLGPIPFEASPAIGLALGAFVGLVLGNPWPKQSSAWSKKLLQASVIGLGFGLSAGEALRTGGLAIPITLVGIVATYAVGTMLARMLGAEPRTAFLVTTGTAICGGSAIAAMAPVVEADDEQTAVSLATVFTLNATALVLFPPLGRALELGQAAFGTWAAMAIHDTSSVVGACHAYGEAALATGTTVKLTRALWIVPLVLTVAWWRRSEKRAPLPVFLLGFVAAVVLRALLPQLEPVWSSLVLVARRALVVVLVLIGTGLTRQVLGRVGARPLALGVVLWALVSGSTLMLIRAGLVPGTG